MKKHRLWRVLTHMTLVLSALFLTLLVLDRYNPSMDFIASDVSKIFLLAFALCALASSLAAAVFLFRERRREGQKREGAKG